MLRQMNASAFTINQENKPVSKLEHESLLTIEKTCERLSIGRTSAFMAIRDGRLRAVKIGRATRIPSSALDEFLASLPQVEVKAGKETDQ